MGVASWSAGCGPYEGYGVYADVLKLKKWIRKTIQYSQWEIVECGKKGLKY